MCSEGSRAGETGKTRRLGYYIFAAGALLYLVAVLLASSSPGPRAWGLHLTGFLDLPPRLLVLTLLGVGVAASLAFALAPSIRLSQVAEAATSTRGIDVFPFRYQLALLAAYGVILWLLHTRTHFLGDGVFWLRGLREGDLPPSPEPLAQAIWLAASSVLRSIGAPIVTVALISIACGLAAAALLWRIASEITNDEDGFITAFLLLLTMGSAQLFFGYIESYPPLIVAILGYILAGLRYARQGRGALVLVLTFAVAIVTHLIALYLTPSLLFLIWRGPSSLFRRGALIGFALALPVSILLLLGSEPSQWIHAFDVAIRAARAGPAASSIKPYEILSVDHAVDVANELILVIPVPLLLLLAAIGEGRVRGLRTNPGTAFLAIAAGFGLVGLLALVLPVAPAQDWDLMSTLVLPLGILGVWAGRSLYAQGGRLLRVAVVSISLGSLLSFVFVEASAKASTRRYETLIGPGAKVSGFARWYAYELLAHYYRHQHDYNRAMGYVELLLNTAPGNPRYWGMAGETLMRIGYYDQAIPFLEESLRRNPNRATARTNLGICYTALRRYDEALGEFREAVRLDPDRPDYRHNLGLAFNNAGSPDSARAVWTDLLRRWPRYGPTLRAMTKYFGI